MGEEVKGKHAEAVIQGDDERRPKESTGTSRLRYTLAMVVAFADTVEEVCRLKQEIDARLRRIGRRGDIVPWVPKPEIREQFGLRALPAVVVIRNWPGDFEVLCEGGAPSDDVLELCAEFFVNDSEARIAEEKSRRTLEEARRNAPKTLEEAVRRLLSKLSEEDKRMVSETPEEDLGKFHFRWGLGIRNDWLHGSDGQLFQSCGTNLADEASIIIIRAVWTALRSEQGNR